MSFANEEATGWVEEADSPGLYPGVTRHGWRETFYEVCLKEITLPGPWAEFGVGPHAGTARRWIKALPTEVRLHLFDRLEGLPEPWEIETPEEIDRRRVSKKAGAWIPDYPAGLFKYPHEHRFNDDRVTTHYGLFAETLPVDFHDPLAFVHIDCDLYTSTRDVLTGIASFVVPGTVFIFDELVAWRHVNTNWRANEWRAYLESGLRIEWRHRCQFAMCGIVT